MKEQPDTDITAQVTEFHLTMGYPVRTKPCQMTADEVHLRLRLITEEFFELLDACGLDRAVLKTLSDGALTVISIHAANDAFAVDLPKLADAMADLDYVVEGTRLTCGVGRAPIAAAVHAANMAKVEGGYDEHGKKKKPEGWQPPDIAGELRRQGWKG